MEHVIDRAAAALGSQKALAVALGVTRAAVWQWKEDGRQVPAEHCIAIEKLTAGTVRCEELRPDLDWAYLRNKPTELRKRKDAPAIPEKAGV